MRYAPQGGYHTTASSILSLGFHHDWAKEAAEIAVPTLVLHGGQDLAARVTLSKDFASLLKNAEFHTVRVLSTLSSCRCCC